MGKNQFGDVAGASAMTAVPPVCVDVDDELVGVLPQPANIAAEANRPADAMPIIPCFMRFLPFPRSASTA
jgi:hypothetical protein